MSWYDTFLTSGRNKRLEVKASVTGHLAASIGEDCQDGRNFSQVISRVLLDRRNLTFTAPDFKEAAAEQRSHVHLGVDVVLSGRNPAETRWLVAKRC